MEVEYEVADSNIFKVEVEYEIADFSLLPADEKTNSIIPHQASPPS
jgi:hypothetical protein